MRRHLESQVIVTSSHRLDPFLDSFVFRTWYTQPEVLEVTGESHCASGKLIVARIGRTGGRGRSLGEHVVVWKLLGVCGGRPPRVTGKGKAHNISDEPTDGEQHVDPGILGAVTRGEWIMVLEDRFEHEQWL